MRPSVRSFLYMCGAAALGLASACAPAGDEVDFSAGPGGKGDDPTGVTLAYRSYDVLFTNPLCATYAYPAPVATADGAETLTTRPENVWCTPADAAASGARASSPQYRIVEWVRALGAGDELFMAYLSFSNRTVSAELCAAAQRGAEVTIVLDTRSAAADEVEACGATILLRGHQGSIGYAHNKIILINPNGAGPADPFDGYMRLSFSSGNLSSGTVTHHENWHFMEVRRESYFAQAHRCLMESQLDPAATASKGAYRTALNTCRAAIPYAEEDDIKAFFIPNRDDAKRATRYLIEPIAAAASVDLGAHRFGHTDLVNALAARLADGTGFTLRMVADDDLYWLDPLVGEGAAIGNNSWNEAANVRKLEAAGGDAFEIRFLETNHTQHLLHHNKFLIYRDADGEAFGLLCGAANLTKAGFNDNLENIYFVTIPHVLAQFDTQFARFWDGTPAEGDTQAPPKATPAGKMPASL